MRLAGRTWLAIAFGMLGVAASGCSTEAHRVDCDGRLEPINLPAPKQAEASPKTRKQAPR